jgi:hypothetical protein
MGYWQDYQRALEGLREHNPLSWRKFKQGQHSSAMQQYASDKNTRGHALLAGTIGFTSLLFLSIATDGILSIMIFFCAIFVVVVLLRYGAQAQRLNNNPPPAYKEEALTSYEKDRLDIILQKNSDLAEIFSGWNCEISSSELEMLENAQRIYELTATGSGNT